MRSPCCLCPQTLLGSGSLKHVSAAVNTDATIEELLNAMFSVRSVIVCTQYILKEINSHPIWRRGRIPRP
jgi:hypothetical protein